MIGPKPPLKPRHIWAIRTRLDLALRVRDLAMLAAWLAKRGRRDDPWLFPSRARAGRHIQTR